MDTRYVGNTSGGGTTDEGSSMSDGTWGIVLNILEVVLNVIKGVIVVSGVLAFNMADTILGTIGTGLLFDPIVAQSFNLNVWLLGAIPSLGASSVQIFLWSLIKKRNISFSKLIKFDVPKDVKAFMVAAIAVWAIDTFIDVSPLSILMSNSRYIAFPTLYKVLSVSVAVLLFIMCGFAELLTSNMRGMLMITSETKPKTDKKVESRNSNSRNDSTEYSVFNRPQPKKSPSLGGFLANVNKNKSTVDFPVLNDTKTFLEKHKRKTQ